ncbi:Sucrose/H+ symporter plant protein [Dioscorea alata]|uniref:Sucrose/H+ symporter plant protein n=1 Tax=Dioscorea alata TaxID=55571 RepID=A0ACB7U7M5_DIOAL|nr:Sucrose/H+ symporter plant protein [Dioscorea alata]
MEVEVGGLKNVETSAFSGDGAPASDQAATPASLMKLILSSMVAAGVQYGWALQVALLTSYVQTLGLPHSLASMMWLCGPVSAFIVQPSVGVWSDRCYSRFGRRRPFILAACLLICTSALVIAFSSDIGYALGDTKEHCSVYTGKRWKATIVYVVGFWVLDFANNAVHAPSRALMADLAGPGRFTVANAVMCSWFAVGNILGYSSGATRSWHRWFPFLNTRACCETCANLKGAFLIDIVFLIFCSSISLLFAKEVPLEGKTRMATANEQRSGIIKLLKSLKHLPPGMPSVLIVTSLSWLSWFPFFLYNNDWMGREIHHGDPEGTQVQRKAYENGIRDGSFGLLLNSIMLGIGSFLLEPICRKLTTRVVWAISNFILFFAFTSMCIVSIWSTKGYSYGVNKEEEVNNRVRVVALLIFAALGFPLTVLFSVPPAVAAQLADIGGTGQGLNIGILTMFCVIPQVIISVSAGPWDALFHKGNLPAFAMASFFAFVSAFVAFFVLPKLKTSTLSASH